MINYSLPVQGSVNITAYNILGEEVSVILDEIKDTGNYSVLFDGSELSSGVYYLCLRAGNFIQSKKIILLK